MSLKKIRLFRKNEKKLAVSLMLASFMMLTTGFTQKDIQHVQIEVDGRVIDTHTAKVSPERILREAGISLEDKDEYRLKKDGNKTEITVYRAVPVTIDCDGQKSEVLTSKLTVEEALLDMGYQLEDYDSALRSLRKAGELNRTEACLMLMLLLKGKRPGRRLHQSELTVICSQIHFRQFFKTMTDCISNAMHSKIIEYILNRRHCDLLLPASSA